MIDFRQTIKKRKEGKMKKALVLIMLAAIGAMAGVVDPYQIFTINDATLYQRPDQNWMSAQALAISVKANTSVWITTYISNWYDMPADKEVGNRFDMGAGKYGYFDKSSIDGMSLEKSQYANNDIFHGGTGESTDITFYYDGNPSITQTTPGYFLGTFDKDAEIYLYMTAKAEDGGEQMDTYQYVRDDQHEATDLVSRNYLTFDQTNNVRINFGFGSGIDTGHEFVLVYQEEPPTNGQPLPGALLAGLLSIGTVAAGKKLKKH